jgi:hypothetical protein
MFRIVLESPAAPGRAETARAWSWSLFHRLARRVGQCAVAYWAVCVLVDPMQVAQQGGQLFVSLVLVLALLVVPPPPKPAPRAGRRRLVQVLEFLA